MKRCRLFHAEMIMQRDCGTNDHCDCRIDQALVYAAADVVPLENCDSTLNILHPSRLAVPDQHVDLRFQLPQLFQDLALKLVVVYAQEHGRVASAQPFFNFGVDFNK